MLYSFLRKICIRGPGGTQVLNNGFFSEPLALPASSWASEAPSPIRPAWGMNTGDLLPVGSVLEPYYQCTMR